MITKVITAHVPAPLAKKVDELASSLDRSRGWIVKEALSAWVAQEEERRQWTIDALADVDAGRVADHESVRAWAASLGSKAAKVTPAAMASKPAKPGRSSRKR